MNTKILEKELLSVTNVICLLLFLLFLYFDALYNLITVGWQNEDFNYCIIIPFLVAYLFFQKKNLFFNTPKIISLFGFFPLIFGLLLFWIGELGGEYFSLYISFWLVNLGLIIYFHGFQRLKIILFPVFFSLSMFPFPAFINNNISLHLKLISSKLGVLLLQLYGLPSYREGNVIDLGFVQLQVVDACSGLRFLLPLAILGLLISYFYKGAIWKKIILIASVIPIAIGTNSARIALTGVIYKYWGAEVAEGFFHSFSGWLIFVLSLIIFIFIKILLDFFFPSAIKTISNDTNQTNNYYNGKNLNNYYLTNIKYSKFFIYGFFIITIIFSYFFEFRDEIPNLKPFVSFPDAIGEWKGSSKTIEQSIVNSLNLTDYILMDFHDDKGNTINFYVSYYASQRKGKSVHSPESCMPGNGWQMQQSHTISLKIDKAFQNETYSNFVKLRRALIVKNNYKQLSYYWFPQRGRILNNIFQLKFYAFWDAITKHRTDGALVRLITPIREKEKIIEADKRLQEFIKKLFPLLNSYIPD